MTTDTTRLAIRHQITIQKYHGEVDPDNPGDEPFETIQTVGWYEADGTLITDPERIAALKKAGQ